MSDNLIFGKANLKGIVGIEVTDGSTDLFIQREDGSVYSKFTTNRFWILSSKNINGKFKRLEGDLHYCWGTQFQDEKTWKKMRSIWKNDDIYSVWNQEEAMMVKDGYTMYQGLKLSDVSLLSFDIETTGLDPNAKDAAVVLISTTYRDQFGQCNKLFSYDEYKSEGAMLDAFSNYIQEKNSSIIIGHNIFVFDLPYLDSRASAWNTSLNWGRDESRVQFEDYESKFRMDGTRELLYRRVKIYGREIVDTFFLASSYDVSKSIESYSLKPMIKQLGLEKEGRQFYDAALIRENYKDPVEFAKIKQYAIDDAEDPVKLWDLMGPLYFNMATMFPKPLTEILLSASGSKINALMCRAYLQDGHSLPKASPTRKYQGALSFAVPGLYQNCFKIDLSALYPSIMIEYEVYDEEKDPKAYLLYLVKAFRAKRLEYKKLAAETGLKYWIEMDTTAKSILNSFYGFTGTSGLNFNNFEIADFITGKGREILAYTINWASGKDLKEFVTEDEEEIA